MLSGEGTICNERQKTEFAFAEFAVVIVGRMYSTAVREVKKQTGWEKTSNPFLLFIVHLGSISK